MARSVQALWRIHQFQTTAMVQARVRHQRVQRRFRRIPKAIFVTFTGHLKVEAMRRRRLNWEVVNWEVVRLNWEVVSWEVVRLNWEVVKQLGLKHLGSGQLGVKERVMM